MKAAVTRPTGSPDGGPRERVLVAVDRTPDGMTLEQLVAAVGLSPSTLRFHLGRLIAQDAVRAVPRPRGGKGRPPMVYQACARTARPARGSEPGSPEPDGSSTGSWPSA